VSPVGITMKKSTKRWVSGVAAAGIVLGSLSIPQVQAAAGELLSIFRLNQVEFVKVTEQDMMEAEQWFEQREIGSIDLKGIGKFWTEGKGETYQSLSYDQAVKEGYPLPKVPTGYVARDIQIINPRTTHFQLNTEGTNKLLQQLQANVKLDDQLNGKTFSIVLPKEVNIRFENVKNDSSLEYTVWDIPQLRVEKGVDVDKLRETVLSLPFIPEPIKKHFLNMKDWQHTLPVLINEGDSTGKARETKINGAKGIIQENERETTLTWEKDGKIYRVSQYFPLDEKNGTEQLLQWVQQFK
jgi:hypothetical protein